MMTDQLQISVLCAPVAAMDRRALSQAWYSALHTASASAATTAYDARASVLEQPSSGVLARNAAPSTTGASPRLATSIAINQASTPRASHEVLERRMQRSTLARRIERTFLRSTSRVKHATFRIEGTSARVHIALHTVGNKVRLIAVCSRAVHREVERALAQARFSLAARGIELSLASTGGFVCS